MFLKTYLLNVPLQLLEELQAAGLAPNAKTHELLVDSAVVAGDVPGMLAALQVGILGILDVSHIQVLPILAM